MNCATVETLDVTIPLIVSKVVEDAGTHFLLVGDWLCVCCRLAGTCMAPSFGPDDEVKDHVVHSFRGCVISFFSMRDKYRISLLRCGSRQLIFSVAEHGSLEEASLLYLGYHSASSNSSEYMCTLSRRR